MERLDGVVMHYAWGSTTHLARMRGERFSTRPESELWLGAHPVASAVLPSSGGIGLLEAIETDPDLELGADVAAAFGGRLPYLLKLLAADSPLSVQVHPSVAEAKVGFQVENDSGLGVDDPRRSFRDDNHKPELIVALTPFEALVGFNTPAAVLELFDAFAVEELASVRDLIDEEGVHAGLEAIVTLDRSRLASATMAIVDRLDNVAPSRHDDAELIGRIAELFPGDPGVVVAMLLNRIVLEPGEGVYLGAGVLHAYVSGFGVEIMANCDNVVRGGLTSKHIDTETLCRIVDPDAGAPTILRPTGSETTYRTPVPEFELTRLVAPSGWSHTPVGPEIVLGASGTTTVSQEGVELELGPGEAAWIRSGTGDYEVTSDGDVFVASVGAS